MGNMSMDCAKISFIKIGRLSFWISSREQKGTMG